MTTMTNTILETIPTTEKITVDSYPYGRLRATAFFSLEFNPKKGFRSVFQTIDPKNGRVNKVKNSTYYPMMLMYKETETEHIKYNAYWFNGDKETNKGCAFMYIHFDKFTSEQIEYIYKHIYNMLNQSRVYLNVHSELEREQVEAQQKNYLDCINLCKRGIQDKNNVFDKIFIKIN
jgi:hypothetical protein